MDDMQYWLSNPPYLYYWAKFNGKLAQVHEREKTFKGILLYSLKKNVLSVYLDQLNHLPHRKALNEWVFLSTAGNIYSLFKAGTKLNYNYQAKFEIDS